MNAITTTSETEASNGSSKNANERATVCDSGVTVVVNDSIREEDRRIERQEEKGEPAVQVYVRIRPLIKEENDHRQMEYKIIETGPSPLVDDPMERNPDAGANRRPKDYEEQEQGKENVGADDAKTTSNNKSKLRIKLPAEKKRAMTPAFHQRFLLLQQQNKQREAESNCPPPPPRFLGNRPNEWRDFSNFAKILDMNTTNKYVYESTIQSALIRRLLPSVAKNANQCTSSPSLSLCVFTYGHTGSGKSHTLLGYDAKGGDNLGIYKYAARDLVHHLSLLNGNISGEQDDANDTEMIDQEEEEKEQYGVVDHNNKDKPENSVVVGGGKTKGGGVKKGKTVMVRMIELYKDKVRDLLTGNDCTVREDGNGIVRVRGPMREDTGDNGIGSGRIEPAPLGESFDSWEGIVARVDGACRNRRVGSSTHHDQSSRSHLVIEMEIVKPEYLEQRNHLSREETHLLRLQWLQAEWMFKKKNTGCRPMPRWTKEYSLPSGGNDHRRLRRDIQRYEKMVRESWRKVSRMEEDDHLLGNTLVFCDLAGNEYARDSITAGSTKEEAEEAAEINKSLLAIKEMIRSLNCNGADVRGGNKQQQQQLQQRHISYRDSKLSMLLKRHVSPQNGYNESGRAIMLGHISPSQEHIRKTLNTLKYCTMVGHSSRANTNRKNR